MRKDPVTLSAIRHLDRFSESTDAQAQQFFQQMAQTSYSYPNATGERIAIGKPVSYRYAVNPHGDVVLALTFKNSQQEIWSNDSALKPSTAPMVLPINRKGRAVAKNTPEPILFDGMYEQHGETFYTSSEYDKLVGFSVAHRASEVNFVD